MYLWRGTLSGITGFNCIWEYSLQFIYAETKKCTIFTRFSQQNYWLKCSWSLGQKAHSRSKRCAVIRCAVLQLPIWIKSTANQNIIHWWGSKSHRGHDWWTRDQLFAEKCGQKNVTWMCMSIMKRTQLQLIQPQWSLPPTQIIHWKIAWNVTECKISKCDAIMQNESEVEKNNFLFFSIFYWGSIQTFIWWKPP